MCQSSQASHVVAPQLRPASGRPLVGASQCPRCYDGHSTGEVGWMLLHWRFLRRSEWSVHLLADCSSSHLYLSFTAPVAPSLIVPTRATAKGDGVAVVAVISY